MPKPPALRQSVDLSFLGTGDAFASDGRFQSGYLIEAADYRILMEAGPTVLCAMKRMKVAPGSINLILISHLHGDHYGGLPFLLLEYTYESPLNKTITIAGPPHLEERTWLLYETMFPRNEGNLDRLRSRLRFVVLEPGVRQRAGKLQVDTIRTPHMVYEPSLALKFNFGGKTIAFSGDSGWTDELISFTAGADLFLCECTYFESAHLKFHMNYPQLAQRRRDFDVGRMILTHIGREVLAKRGKLGLETARDGLKIRI
jgi:ribonuclease BN (tRNA processing enzyme)